MDEIKTDQVSPSYAIPGAIIVAGLIIAGAVYYRGASGGPAAVGAPAAPAESAALKLENIRPIGADDHLRGNPAAPIKIIEYSDLECPYCKNFHQTMRELVAAYPDKIAWVFRHFPLDQLHSQARTEAAATECVAELGGAEKFWAYTDKIFELTPSNNGLDLTKLPMIAEELGLNRQAFDDCLASGRTAARVDADYQNAIQIGGRGTPLPVILGPGDKKFALEGAVPLAGMKQLIDTLLAQ